MTDIFDAYAAYYDLIYRDKDYAGEAGYVRSLLARAGVPGGRLLELGCGTGRHAEHLARLGYAVHGIDSSERMVERARRAIPADLGAQLRFDTADARSVRLPTLFDGVVALFHVASYQSSNEDLAAMLATAATHLRPGGVFVFDFWYGPGVLTDRPAVRVKRLEDRDANITRIAEPSLHPNTNTVDVHYTVLVKQRATGITFELEEMHRMRYLFLPELQLLLQGAGMRMLSAERWLSGELGLTSWLGVVTAGKPA